MMSRYNSDHKPGLNKPEPAKRSVSNNRLKRLSQKTKAKIHKSEIPINSEDSIENIISD